MSRAMRGRCVYENGVLKTTSNPDGTTSVYVFSGTSFAAPPIAGAVALLRQAFPNLTAAQVVDLLLRTATDAGTAGIDATYARGLMNITAAFAPQGVTTLPGGTSATPLGDSTMVASAAMGDALSTAGHVDAIVLDAYARAYQVNLASNMRAANPGMRLTGALSSQSRNLTLGAGKLSLAFSVDAKDAVSRLPWQGQLRLSGRDAEMAKVLATRVVARIAPNRQIAFAFGQGADGLVAQMQGRSQPAFLIAGSPLDDFGFIRRGENAAALRQQIGPWGLSLSAATAGVQTGPEIDSARGPFAHTREEGMDRFGLSLDRRFGGLETAFGATWLREAQRQAVIGGQHAFARHVERPGRSGKARARRHQPAARPGEARAPVCPQPPALCRVPGGRSIKEQAVCPV